MPLFLIVGTFLGAAFQAVSGFGGAIVMVVFFSTFLDIHVFTPLIAVLSIVTNICILLLNRQKLDFRRVRRLILPSLVGLPVGVLLLMSLEVDRQTVQYILAGVILFLVVLYWWGIKGRRVVNVHYAWFLPFLAGITGYAFNINGPLIAMGILSEKVPKEQAVPMASAYFLIFGLILIAAHQQAGFLTSEVSKYFGRTIPLVVGGVVVGTLVGKYLKQDGYENLVLWFMIASVIALLV